MNRWAQSAAAERWMQQLRDPHAPGWWLAGRRLAKLMVDADDVTAAEQLLLLLTERADGTEIPRVWLQLAHLYLEEGRADDAANAFEQAAGAEPDATPDVLVNLAARWACVGEIDRAISSYRLVAEQVTNEHRELAALARYRLAHLYEEKGDVASATACWRSALPEADESLWPHVAIELARALDAHGTTDLDEIRDLLTAVIDSDHPDLAPAAALMLASRARAGGELALTRHLYELVLASEHPEYVQEARQRLDDLLQDRVRDLVSDLNDRTWQEATSPTLCEDLGPSLSADTDVVASSGSDGIWVLPRPDPLRVISESGVVCSGAQLTYVVGVHLRATAGGLQSVEIDVALHVPAVLPRIAVSAGEGVAQWALSLGASHQQCARLVRSMKDWVQRKLPALVASETLSRLGLPSIFPASRLASLVARRSVTRSLTHLRGDMGLDERIHGSRISSADLSCICCLHHDTVALHAPVDEGLELGPSVRNRLALVGGLAANAGVAGWPTPRLPCRWVAGPYQFLRGDPRVAAGLYSGLPDGHQVVKYLQLGQKQLPAPCNSTDLDCCH